MNSKAGEGDHVGECECALHFNYGDVSRAEGSQEGDAGSSEASEDMTAGAGRGTGCLPSGAGSPNAHGHATRGGGEQVSGTRAVVMEVVMLGGYAGECAEEAFGPQNSFYVMRNDKVTVEHIMDEIADRRNGIRVDTYPFQDG